MLNSAAKVSWAFLLADVICRKVLHITTWSYETSTNLWQRLLLMQLRLRLRILLLLLLQLLLPLPLLLRQPSPPLLLCLALYPISRYPATTDSWACWPLWNGQSAITGEPYATWFPLRNPSNNHRVATLTQSCTYHTVSEVCRFIIANVWMTVRSDVRHTVFMSSVVGPWRTHSSMNMDYRTLAM